MIKDNKIVSWIIGTFGVIILGAIGSGVWQILGEPIVDLIAKFIINSMGLIFSTYKDSIYSTASLGFHESSANNTYVLLLLLISCIPVSFLLGRRLGKTTKNTSPEIKNKTLRIFKGFVIINIILMVSMSLNIVTKINYVASVILYVEVSLDRLAPYESPSKLAELKAQFREVTTATEYYQLYDDIEALIKSNGLKSRSVAPL
jgi:hypothetical protein